MKHIKTLTLAVSVAMLSACSTLPNSNTSGGVYKEGQALSQAQIFDGVIVHIQDIEVEQNHGMAQIASAGLGGVLGAAAGSNVGKGTGRQLGMIVGALGGAMLGSTMGDKMGGRVPGNLFTVRFANGEQRQIAQAKDPSALFSVGEKVSISRMVMSSGGQSGNGVLSSHRRSRQQAQVQEVWRVTKASQS